MLLFSRKEESWLSDHTLQYYLTASKSREFFGVFIERGAFAFIFFPRIGSKSGGG
jgi:hypothetical protein